MPNCPHKQPLLASRVIDRNGTCEATTMVALACREADPFCFCGAFGINPVEAPGADVLAWWDGEYLILEACTEKKEARLNPAGDRLEECSTGNKPVPHP
jgi:sulfhydrogenase subunit beta (sulfur reductase)